MVDTRLDRAAFMARHIPGSLHARFDRTFNTVVGSLVEDEQRPLLLVIDEQDVEEAVRDLAGIGYDQVIAFVDPPTLERYWAQGGASASILVADMRAMGTLWRRPDHVVVDVRTAAAEYREGHVPGAVLAPYTRLPRMLDRIPEGETAMVYCRTGSWSAAAAAFLAALGRPVVWVDGDWSEWMEHGLPVEGTPGAAPQVAVTEAR